MKLPPLSSLSKNQLEQLKVLIKSAMAMGESYAKVADMLARYDKSQDNINKLSELEQDKYTYLESFYNVVMISSVDFTQPDGAIISIKSGKKLFIPIASNLNFDEWKEYVGLIVHIAEDINE